MVQVGFSLNPFHDVAEVAHDIKNDVVKPVVRDVASPSLKALNMPLQTVQHVYTTEHDVWTRYGVGAFLNDNTWRLLGGAVDKNLDPQISHSWAITGNGGTGFGSLATSNPRYRDIYGNVVNPGYDLANVIDHVLHGRDYVPNGWHLDDSGIMQPDVDPVTGQRTGGIDFFSGAVNGVFDLSLDPMMAAAKVGKAAKEGGVVIGAGKAIFGGKTIRLADDSATKAKQFAEIARSGAPVSITADGTRALVGGRVLTPGRIPKLLVDVDGTRASNIPYLVANNTGVRDAFGRLAKLNRPEQVLESYPALLPLAGDLAKAKTVQDVSNVFEQALTARNYGFLQHALPTTSLTRRIAYRAGMDLPTAAKVASNVADSNRLFRSMTSYRPFALDSKTLELSGKTFNPEDPSFLKAFRDSLLISQNRRVANAIVGSYIDTPDLGARINMITHMMRDTLREAGVPDDHELMQKYGRDIDYLNKNSMRQVYGVDKDGRPIYGVDPATGEPINFGLYQNQIGKIALPDFNEVRSAIASTKGPMGWLTRGDDWLYKHYTTKIFKNLVLLSLGFGLRVASGELVPAILQNDFKTTLGSSLEAAAAKLNPTLKDLSDEYGPDALVGKSARVSVPTETDEGVSNVRHTGRIVSVAPEAQTVTVKHGAGETVHDFGKVTVLQRDIKDAHIIKVAQNMGIEVSRQEVPHIRAAVGAALHGVGAALVDQDYYDTALRNILSLDGHLVAPGLASNHDIPGSGAGAAADLADAYKQAGAQYPENPHVLGAKFRLYDSGQDNHPIFWNYAIHEAAKDPGATLGAKAYLDAINRGASEQEATKAFIDADLGWMRDDPAEDAEQFRTNMALYHQGAPEYARLRAESMKGLAYGQNGKLNKDVLAALAGEREVPTIADLANRDEDLRPRRVKGRILDPVAAPGTIDKISARGWRVALHPVINGMSRAPIYTMLTTKEYKFFKPWVDTGLMDANEAHHIAQVRAANRMLPLIHNTKLRSQMSDLTRNFFPFYFAQEQAYKRYGRVIAHDPLAFRKFLLAAHGISNSGVTRADANGNQSIVLPGGSLYGRMVTGAFAGLGMNVMAGLPSTISGDTISLKSVIPEGNLPSLSPLVAVGLEQIQHMFPATEPALSPIIGPINQSESVTDQLIPNASIKRALQASPWGDRSNAFATAYMNNMAAAKYRSDELNAKADQAAAEGNNARARQLRNQANQWWAPATADPAQKQDVFRRIKNATRIQMYLKAVVGLVSPLSPVLDTGDAGIKTEVQQSMKKYGVSQGLDRFLQKNPNATAYSVFLSNNKSTGSSPPATQAALDWIEKNKSWIGSHKLAAAYLVPQTAQAFDVEAYNQELADGLRAKRDPGTGDAEPGSMVAALYSAATDAKYYPSLDNFEKAYNAAAGNSALQHQLTQEWDQYKTQLENANPIWAANQPSKSPQAIQVAQLALHQLNETLSSSDVPDSPQVELAKTLTASYNSYLETENQVRVGLEQGLSLTDLKNQFNDYLDQYVAAHPDASAMVTGIFRRLVNASG